MPETLVTRVTNFQIVEKYWHTKLKLAFNVVISFYVHLSKMKRSREENLERWVIDALDEPFTESQVIQNKTM